MLDRYARTIGRLNCDSVDANKGQMRLWMAWVYWRHAGNHSVLYAIENGTRIHYRRLRAEPYPAPP